MNLETIKINLEKFMTTTGIDISEIVVIVPRSLLDHIPMQLECDIFISGMCPPDNCYIMKRSQLLMEYGHD